MYLKARFTPASAPGGHTWEDETSVVEVPNELGHQLAQIRHQFYEVLPGDPDYPGLEPAPAPNELDLGTVDGPDPLEPEKDAQEHLEPTEPEEDLIGETSSGPKMCARENCGNFAKRGEDFCRHHLPK